MEPRPTDDRSWEVTLGEVDRLLGADVWQGVSKWFEDFSEAVLASDGDRCNQLVTAPLAFPDSLAELVESRFGPGAKALRAGRSADALNLLTADSGETGPIVRACAMASVSDEAASEDQRRVAASGLTGIWFEAINRATDAAAAYFEAGKLLNQLGNEHEDASVQLLERATELDPTHALAHWYLADTWRVRSNSSTPPYVNRAALEQSLAMWNRGAASQLPDADSSWAYVTRALIGEQCARLDNAKRVSFWWESVLYFERALLLDDDDVGRWASLGRCHRLLENERASLHATAQALERNPDDANALDERVAILADTGAFEEARVAIDKRLGLDPTEENLWSLGVKAFILVRQKEYHAALELIDKVILGEPDNIWNLDLKATCCWMLDDITGARDVYETIVRIGGGTTLSSDDKRTCAFAAYRLGRTDDAIAGLQEVSDDGLLGNDVSRMLGLCYFVKGETDRAEELILSRITRASARELDDFLSFELSDLESRRGAAQPAPRELASLARIKTIVGAVADRRRVSAGDARLAAEEELTRVLQSRGTDPAARMAVAGARAGVARLQLEGERWRDAAATFLAMQSAEASFPEANAGLARAANGIRDSARKLLDEHQLPAALERFREFVAVESGPARKSEAVAARQELGDVLWRAGHSGEAIEQFEEALTLTTPQESALRADLFGRLGFARYQQGETDHARESYAHALRLYRDAGHDEPGHSLADACRPLLRGVDDFWAVDSSWRVFVNDAGADQVARTDIGCALDSIATYLDEVYRLSEPLAAETAMLFVTPIALEIGSALVPLVDPASDKSEHGRFLNEDIPAMSERIQRSMGVPNMPGIRVHPQPANTEGYVILLDGVAFSSGSVRANSKYVAEPSDLHESGLSLQSADEAVDPSSGLAGRWYPKARLKSEMEFILSHVEAVLRQHLERFLGVDETRTLLTELQKEASHAGFASPLLDDRESLDALVRVLRALLRENVPITDWTTMIDVIEGCDLTNVDEAVQAIRLALKEHLPGNQEITSYIQVPAEWDRADGEMPMAASPALAHQRLIAIRRWLQSRSGPVALVTGSAQLRLVVRRLIEYEFPSVPVLLLDEVIRPEHVVSAETLQVTPEP